MRKFILKSILYLVLVVVIVNFLAILGLWSLRKSEFFKTTYLINHFEKEQAFDLTVFGSSRSLSALDTKLIGDSLSGTAINFSMVYSSLPSSLLMLKHFYHQGYTSKWVVVSIDLPDFEESKTVISENDYVFIPYAKDPHIRDYFAQYEEGVLKPIYTTKYFPALSFSYYNMELLPPAIQALIKPNYRYRFDDKGNYQYPDYLSLTEMPEPRHFETALSNPILQEIQELAEANGSKLVVYIAPYLRDNIKVKDNSPYTVINHARLLNDPAYFFDYIHVVTRGKQVASEAFVEDFNRIMN